MNRFSMIILVAGLATAWAAHAQPGGPQQPQQLQQIQRQVQQQQQAMQQLAQRVGALEAQENALPAGAETVALESFLDSLSDDLGIEFLIDVRSRHAIYVGGSDVDDIDYPKLLSILRNNQLIGVEVGGRINVVPESLARAMPVPLVQEDDPDIADDELVTRIIRLQNMSAPQAVPILRPILPQYAHLAALPDQNALVLVDRYANVRRLTEIARELDR